MKIKKLRKELKKAQKKYGNIEVMLPQVIYLEAHLDRHYHAKILHAEIGVHDDNYIFTIY